MSPTAATYTVTSPPNAALTPPPGAIPDFHEPYTLQTYLELECGVSIAITTAVIAARTFVKAKVVKKFLWEDFTAIIGWITYLVFLAFEWRTGVRGAGTHQWNLTTEQVQYDIRLSNYGDMSYCISIACVKLSILLLILRIFLSVNRDVFWWMTQLLVLFNTIFYTISFFIAIFGCTPRSKMWNEDIPGQCLDGKVLYVFSASFNICPDIAMLTVPIYLVWTLQTRVKRKIGISAVFATGFLACVSSVFRLVYQLKLIHTKDYSFVKVQTALWGNAEVACGILCGSLPILPLLWHHISRHSAAAGTSLAPVQNVSPGKSNGYSPSRLPKNWDEAFEEHQRRANGDWAEMNGGMRGERERDEEGGEQAIHDAVVGVGHGDAGGDGKMGRLSMRISGH